MKGLKIIVVLLLITVCNIQAQQITLSLDRVIDIAADSSLESFRSKNVYMSGYWEFRSYRAERLPSLTMDITPARYYRDIVQRYDSENDIDVYRPQQSYFASGGFAVKQNFDLLGGSFFANSDLSYLRNFGTINQNQYSSIPIRVGYSQDLLGYNRFKWERRIEPLKYEMAKKELLFNLEKINEQATSNFFALAMAQAEYDLAKKNVSSTDTLYQMGQQRHKIASISQADLLTLKLDAVNARNTLQNADIALKRAMFALASFLNLDQHTQIRLLLPNRPSQMNISAEKALALARENNPQFLELRKQILEAEQSVDRTKKESLFNASINASLGFNQMAYSFHDVYRNPMRQDVFSVSVSIPLLDWGVRKGRYNMAKNNLNVIQISSQQTELTIEEDVIMTVSDFNIQQDMIVSAEEALDLAVMAYTETRQRFIIGSADINSLTLSLNRQQEAQRNYITALQNYWLSYFKIRRLTLFDFAAGLSLSSSFDFSHGL
jgi:Outer membrane protein